MRGVWRREARSKPHTVPSRSPAPCSAAERLGIAPEVIEAQRAHAVGDALGRAYNRTKFMEQRRDMMLKWADYLDRLREGAQVLPLRAA